MGRMMFGMKVSVEKLMELDSSQRWEEKDVENLVCSKPPQRSKKCCQTNCTLSSVQQLGLLHTNEFSHVRHQNHYMPLGSCLVEELGAPTCLLLFLFLK